MKILIADDEPLIIELLTEYLTAAGHTVASAHDADTLAEMVRQDIPELIFLDINMPGIRNTAASPQIEIPQPLKRIPIVAITGNERKKVYQLGLPENIQVIQKPVNFAEVDAAIKKFSSPV